jgi:hypothetical protein
LLWRSATNVKRAGASTMRRKMANVMGFPFLGGGTASWRLVRGEGENEKKFPDGRSDANLTHQPYHSSTGGVGF